MKVLDNYDRYSFGGHVLTNNKYPNGIAIRETTSRNKLYRYGTGSRKRPVPSDETAYTRLQVNHLSPQGNGSWRSGNQFSKWSGSPPLYLSNANAGIINLDLRFDSNILDVANLNALRKFDQRDWDLGTAWFERHKTVSLVHGVAITAVDALRAIKRRNGRELLNALGLDHTEARARGVVDANLAYHYGMKPLLQDVQGAVRALTRVNPDEWRITCTGKYGDVRKKITECGVGNFNPFRSYSSLRESCRVKISAIQRPLTREQDLAWSLGLDNQLGTAWELVPYSFVVDWMIPVGDWLSALNSLKYYTGWQTVSTSFFKEEMTVESLVTSLGNVRMESNIGGGLYQSIGVERKIRSVLPLLGLPVKDPISVGHMAKALSLLASASAGSADFRPMIRY